MNFAVCAIVKNENKYLNEWIEHYKKLGFSLIYIFDNNDINGEDPKDIISDKIVFINSDYRGKHDKFYQPECYTKFYNENKHLYDWILFCDIDEFLILENYNTIEEFILSNNEFNNYDAIAICWKIYDDNNLIYYENKPVMERFTHPSETTTNNTQIKSLIKCQNKYLSICAHGAYNIKYCNVLGEKIENLKFPRIGQVPIHKKCWINHYRYKTIEEYILSKYKNFTQKYIYSKYIGFEYFFSVNKFTNEKLNIIKSYGLNYEHNIK